MLHAIKLSGVVFEEIVCCRVTRNALANFLVRAARRRIFGPLYPPYISAPLSLSCNSSLHSSALLSLHFCTLVFLRSCVLVPLKSLQRLHISYASHQNPRNHQRAEPTNLPGNVAQIERLLRTGILDFTPSQILHEIEVHFNQGSRPMFNHYTPVKRSKGWIRFRN